METTLWIDKACIPQNKGAEIKMQYVLMIEHFINLSDSLLVLLSHSYFTRLWYCHHDTLPATISMLD